MSSIRTGRCALRGRRATGPVTRPASLIAVPLIVAVLAVFSGRGHGGPSHRRVEAIPEIDVRPAFGMGLLSSETEVLDSKAAAFRHEGSFPRDLNCGGLPARNLSRM